ncbi:MAG TPA: tetratricopeptide repeat-containing glycosyltransferase family protein [Caulobacteraceae bacterium]|jgi:tetratricopeptide (TPR) repeat protein|nr:tetratricopeptide repeat-containing glycosyltransferase family protein [Caulobacteraceae bacterium]
MAASNPARLQAADGEVSDATSRKSIERFNLALGELQMMKVAPLLRRATAALDGKDWKLAADLALEALSLDERCGLAWHVLAIARDKVGDHQSAIQCYESALALSTDQADIANDLGRLAYRLDMKPLALRLFDIYRAARPDCIQGVNSLACVQRDAHDYGAAIETLRPAIEAHPESALLWNTLGTVLAAQGDMAVALTFFEEALRLDPAYWHALHNRSHARLHEGDLAGALEDCDAAMALPASPRDMVMMRLARSNILLCGGRVGEGWDGYEARLDPQAAEPTRFAMEQPRWTPQSDIAGKSLLLFGEQGLGDEVMFANMIPDVLEALGPQGRLTLAVEPRLVGLFQRSFPTARVGAHVGHGVDGGMLRQAPFIKDPEAIDLWAPMASPLRRFRRTLASFPTRPSFLAADPARVAEWREVLAQRPGLKVGVLWKSLKLDGVRLRYYSPFEQWRPVLETRRVSFVNLQYGDCQAELDQARETLGVEIWQPPGTDLKDDLDDVAALCRGLDLVLGPPTATTNIAAACGAEVWMISTPGAWSLLGSGRHPWYPRVRLFVPDRFNQWTDLMLGVANALADRR